MVEPISKRYFNERISCMQDVVAKLWGLFIKPNELLFCILKMEVENIIYV